MNLKKVGLLKKRVGVVMVNLIARKAIDIFDVSIDKLTIMGNVKGEYIEEFSKVVSLSGIADIWKSGSVAEGKFLNKIFFNYDQAKADAMGRRSFRMELNPNKIKDWELKAIKENILPLLVDVGLSRMDVAFDTDYNLSKLAFIQKNQTSRTKIEGKDGDLETLYLGTRTSEKMVRIYNKSLEMKNRKRKILHKLENGLKQNDVESYDELLAELKDIEESEREVFWRLEFELKREAIGLEESMFDNLKIIEPVINANTVPKVQDRAMLEYLINHPDEWSELKKDSKIKYRKMMRELNSEEDEDLTNEFKKALRQKKYDLSHQVAGWLGLEPEKLFI